MSIQHRSYYKERMDLIQLNSSPHLLRDQILGLHSRSRKFELNEPLGLHALMAIRSASVPERGHQRVIPK